MGTTKPLPPGLVERNGIFYFRLDLPVEVRAKFDRTSVWQSLRTKDYQVALIAFGKLNEEWRTKIAQARLGGQRSVNDAIARGIAQALTHGELYGPEGERLLEDDGAGAYTLPLVAMYRSDFEAIAADRLMKAGPRLDHDGLIYKLTNLTDGDRRAIVDAMQDIHINHLTTLVHAKTDEAKRIETTIRDIAPVRTLQSEPMRGMNQAYDEWKAAGNPTQQTAYEFKIAVAEFIKVAGDVPLKDLNADHFRQYRSYLRTAKSKRGGLLSVASRHKRFAGVKAIVSRAVDEGWIKVNPAADVTIERGKVSPLRQTGVHDDELKALFASPVYQDGFRPQAGGREATYWVPLIAAFTGARQSEICQLAVADVIKLNGVDCFVFTTNAKKGQRTKNQQSNRIVPIAKTLIDLGFFDYLKTLDPKGRLFPDLKPGSHGNAGGAFSQWYNKYRKTIGVDREGGDFHALRHLVKTTLRSIDGDFEVKASITGHSTGNVSAAYGSIPVKQMRATVDLIEYNVTIPRWKPGRITKAV